MVEARLTELDEEFLSSYIKQIPSGGVYVEIGTLYGGSAELARKSNKYISVYGVDPDAQLRFTDFNWIPLNSLDAVKVWDKPIHLLFIDGDHDQAGIDFNAWGKRVIDGGYVFFHDYAHHSPKVVEDCDEIIHDSQWKLIRKPETLVHDNSSIFIIQRCHKSPN